MGAIFRTVAVSNPAFPDRRWQGEFLIDTGAIDCVVPRKHLEAIGIEPEEQRSYRLADGTEVNLDVGIVRLEFMGGRSGVDAVFADDDAQPLLGARAMESLNIEIDMKEHQLRRLPAAHL